MTGGPWLFLITALKQVVDLAHVVLAVDTEDLSQTVNAADLDAICVDLEPCHVVSVLASVALPTSTPSSGNDPGIVRTKALQPSVAVDPSDFTTF